MTALDHLPWLARYQAGKYVPTTFLERGVALPFTSPALLGGRIRLGARKAPELVLANPAGVEGVYILPWSALPDLCTPTLHDRALWDRVAQLPVLTPRTVRQATRAVATEGLAGRAAAQAARQAEQATRQACTITQYHLLLELVRQGDAGGDPDGGRAALPAGDPATLEQRARAVLASRCANTRLSPAEAFEALAELARVFEPCGLTGDPTRARLPRLSAEITAMVEALGRWADLAGPAERCCIRLLAEGAGVTQRCFRHSLDEALALLGDLWTLIQRWRVSPDTVSNLVARPEWLLDGWELICGLWRGTDQGGLAAALIDMAAQVPTIPAEVRDWVGFDAAGTMETQLLGLRRWRRTVQPLQDWATGQILELTMRNEGLRARCV